MPSGEDRGTPTEATDADDPWDALARANTAPESLERAGRRVSLAVALLHCELRFGSTFAHNPARWDTSDGYPPVRIVWAYFMAIAMGRATDALDTARGIGLAFGKNDEPVSPLDRAADEAMPAVDSKPNDDAGV